MDFDYFSALMAGILIALIAIMAFLHWKRKKRPVAIEPMEEPEKPEVLDKNLQDVLQALRENGGQANQKELLEKFPFGEAYLNLVLDRLESDGKIKQIKKDGKNIIILKE